MSSLFRTLAENPSLGNFSDTICQTMKELIENAVDAKPDKVRILLKRSKPPSELLEIHVVDNGHGIDSISNAVNAFHSTKQDSKETSDTTFTSGRFGIGLTCCLIHAQRLAPGTWTWIQSATAAQKYWTRTRCLVDVDTNEIKCLGTENIRKNFPSQHGTSVRLTVPSKDTSVWWPRFRDYIHRFHLVELPCQIELIAPDFMKSNLIIQPQASTRLYLDGYEVHCESHSTVQIRTENDANDNSSRMKCDLVFFGDHVQHNSIRGDDASCTGEYGVPLKVVRIVNNGPLLDTTEYCGLYSALEFDRTLWTSFGLAIHRNENRFSLDDSEQVAPFFMEGRHDMFEDESDHESTKKRSRTSNRTRKKFKPAGERIQNALLVVHITAPAVLLPLSSLSKGCLPRDNEAIDTALSQSLGSILRSLQKDYPDLILTVHELRLVERDCRYVPALAQAVALVLKNASQDVQEQLLAIGSWGTGQIANVEGSEIALTSRVESRLRSICNQKDQRNNETTDKRKSPNGFQDLEAFLSDNEDSSEDVESRLERTTTTEYFSDDENIATKHQIVAEKSQYESFTDVLLDEEQIDPGIRKLVEESLS